MEKLIQELSKIATTMLIGSEMTAITFLPNKKSMELHIKSCTPCITFRVKTQEGIKPY